MKIGTKVKSKVDFSGVPKGTMGIVDEDYGTGFMIAWDMPNSPLPPGYKKHDGQWAAKTGILRDGFDKETELKFLEIVE